MNNKNLKFGCFTLPHLASTFWIRLQALFLGFLLLTSLSALCLAQENVATTKSNSYIAGGAKGKLTNEELFLGIKDTDWNTQNTIGLMFDNALGDYPNFRLTLDYFFGGVSVTAKGIEFCGFLTICNYEHKQTLRVFESDFGVRYYTAGSPVVDLYLGVGLATVFAEFESIRSNIFATRKSIIKGSGRGTYFGVGVRKVFDNGFTLGFDLRDSSAEFALKGEEGEELEKQDYGLRRTSLTLGHSW